jgi:hypothetical protein
MYGISLIMRSSLHGLNSKDWKEHKSNYIVSLKYLSGVLVVLIIALFATAMWDTSVRFYQNYATELGIYYMAEPWISKNLGENEKAFLPNQQTFWAINPQLKDKTYVFRDVYYFPNGTKIYVSPIITQDEVMIVRQNFQNFIHNNTNHVKYVVIDWNDSYGKIAVGLTADELTINTSCKKFDNASDLVKRFSFRLPHSNWGSAMIICEVQKITK